MDVCRRQLDLVVFFAALVLVLVCVGLGNATFWDDEAFVVFAAKNFLAHGVLSSWDGRNLYAPRNGVGFCGTFHVSIPPLDILLAALSVKLFGVSNAAARLPFALCAVASVPVMAEVFRLRIGGRRSLLAIYLTVICLSCAFLLPARNCRYYEASLLLACVTYYAYWRAFTERNGLMYVLFVAASVGLFYASYLLCAAFLLAVAIVHLVYYRREMARAQWVAFGICAVGIGLLTLPYVLRNHGLALVYDEYTPPWICVHTALLWLNLRDLNLWNVLPWMLMVGLWLLLKGSETPGSFAVNFGKAAFRVEHPEVPLESGEPAREAVIRQWTLLIFVYVVWISLLSPQLPGGQSIADIRYLIPILPWAAAASAYFIWRIYRVFPRLGIGVLVVLTATNLFSTVPEQLAGTFRDAAAVRLMLPAYISEITRPYPTCDSAVLDYLRGRMRQDEEIVTSPQYFMYTLMAYEGDTLRTCCMLDQTSMISDAVVRGLGAPLYDFRSTPTWIIVYNGQQGDEELVHYYSRWHKENGRLLRHKYRLVKTIRTKTQEMQRPELPWHSFGPPKDLSTPGDLVQIYHLES
ncbi:MAG: glycosyltransferase family 39 protein [Capsulimonadaceae bacterium]|nr:glycosyltransferase family 39 protein [Capsulimonadaceae bacterium]